MARVTCIHRRADGASCSRSRRERMSIDLRGHGSALVLVARSMQMSAAALVRKILYDWLETRSVAEAGRSAVDVVSLQKESAVIKVTLRMPADYAARLALAARAAELSQGIYVARLIDSLPPAPVAPDQRECRAALMRSNAMLAAMSSDLQALVRTLRRASSPKQTDCNDSVARLSETVLQHLAVAAPLLAATSPSRCPGARDRA